MTATSFFPYPEDGDPGHRAEPAAEGPMAATEAEWQRLLDACETLRFGPGDVIVHAGAHDRAVYLLVDGRLGHHRAPATLGVAEFFTGAPWPRQIAATDHGEVLRLSFEAFEALAARDAHLGRVLLLELGRQLAGVSSPATT